LRLRAPSCYVVYLHLHLSWKASLASPIVMLMSFTTS
jgi:hypothetical protein